MDEEMFLAYTEWADSELIPGKGLDNWKHWRNDAFCPEDKKLPENIGGLFDDIPF